MKKNIFYFLEKIFGGLNPSCYICIVVVPIIKGGKGGIATVGLFWYDWRKLREKRGWGIVVIVG